MTPDNSPSKAARRTGIVLSTIAILFLFVDGGAKLLKLQPVIEATEKLGYNENTVMPIGILLLVCTILYTIPRTSVLGAILLTAYLGGGTTTLVRVGVPFYFPVLMGILVWGGLYLRDNHIRLLIPSRRVG